MVNDERVKAAVAHGSEPMVVLDSERRVVAGPDQVRHEVDDHSDHDEISEEQSQGQAPERDSAERDPRRQVGEGGPGWALR